MESKKKEVVFGFNDDSTRTLNNLIEKQTVEENSSEGETEKEILAARKVILSIIIEQINRIDSVLNSMDIYDRKYVDALRTLSSLSEIVWFW